MRALHPNIQQPPERESIELEKERKMGGKLGALRGREYVFDLEQMSTRSGFKGNTNSHTPITRWRFCIFQMHYIIFINSSINPEQ
jgi:hypothetical protein